jgi:hypothetical protein
MDTSDSGLAVQTLTLGVLFDIDNKVYIGGAHAWDFQDGHKHPGFLVVFGAGPGLLQYLKSKVE